MPSDIPQAREIIQQIVDGTRPYSDLVEALPLMVRDRPLRTARIVHNAMSPQIDERVKAAQKTGKKNNGAKKKPDALTLTHHLLTKYIDMKPHEYTAIALWILHTHVYARFANTPRLSLTSATPECGKTNTFKIISMLAYDCEVIGHTSAAALFRRMDLGGTTLLDEAEALFA
jgi:hypothetical protein